MFSHRPGMSESLDEHTPAVAIPGLMSTSKEDGVQDNLYFCSMQVVNRRSSSSSGSLGTGFRYPPFAGPNVPSLSRSLHKFPLLLFNHAVYLLSARSGILSSCPVLMLLGAVQAQCGGTSRVRHQQRACKYVLQYPDSAVINSRGSIRMQCSTRQLKSRKQLPKLKDRRCD